MKGAELTAAADMGLAARTHTYEKDHALLKNVI
jgi:hypothetical protein